MSDVNHASKGARLTSHIDIVTEPRIILVIKVFSVTRHLALFFATCLWNCDGTVLLLICFVVVCHRKLGRRL